MGGVSVVSTMAQVAAFLGAIDRAFGQRLTEGATVAYDGLFYDLVIDGEPLRIGAQYADSDPSGAARTLKMQFDARRGGSVIAPDAVAATAVAVPAAARSDFMRTLAVVSGVPVSGLLCDALVCTAMIGRATVHIAAQQVADDPERAAREVVDAWRARDAAVGGGV